MIKLSKPDISNDECEAVVRVLKSGQLVHGEECDLFEKELAQYLNCEDVVVVSSGTAALHLSLIALGIGPGDAVLVPDFTFPATVNVIELVGARPVFVDVDIKTYNITAQHTLDAINNWNGKEKVKAIIPVHEFGCPADMTGLLKIAKDYNLKVIEDAACGLGSIHEGKKIGTFGDTGCFSFHPRKAITTGEGGAIAVKNKNISQKIRSWRNHGLHKINTANSFVVPGFNYRLTNFQSALGRVQLRKFDDWLKKRSCLQSIYRRELAGSKFFSLPDQSVGHAWQTFMIVLSSNINREDVITSLRKKGIETNLGAYAIHCQEYYKKKYPTMCKQQIGNNAEILFKHGLALPFCQSMNRDEIMFICEELYKILKLRG